MPPHVSGASCLTPQAHNIIALWLIVMSQAVKLEEELTTIARAAELFQSLRE